MPLIFVVLHWLRFLVRFSIGVVRVKCLVFYPDLVEICSILPFEVSCKFLMDDLLPLQNFSISSILGVFMMTRVLNFVKFSSAPIEIIT